MQQCFHGTVEGRVQGVFFRDSMCKLAQQHGVTGWVKNLADGRVEWLICGDEAAIQTLLAWLQTGPPAAQVIKVNSEPVAAQNFANFEIVR